MKIFEPSAVVVVAGVVVPGVVVPGVVVSEVGVVVVVTNVDAGEDVEADRRTRRFNF